jgi:hypothetical protein
MQPNKRYEPEVPVYNDKFSNAMNKIRLVLKDFQHSLSIVQEEENGTATELKVVIILKN